MFAHLLTITHRWNSCKDKEERNRTYQSIKQDIQWWSKVKERKYHEGQRNYERIKSRSLFTSKREVSIVVTDSHDMDGTRCCRWSPFFLWLSWKREFTVYHHRSTMTTYHFLFLSSVDFDHHSRLAVVSHASRQEECRSLFLSSHHLVCSSSISIAANFSWRQDWEWDKCHFFIHSQGDNCVKAC